MSALKTEKYRYCLFYLLKNIPEGSKFLPEELHITTVPWFVVEPDVEVSLLHSFKTTFAGTTAFEVRVGHEVSLGPREDVSVLLIEPNEQIYNLHQKALEWCESLNSRWAVKHPFVAEEYKPHIRRRQNTSLKFGDILKFDSISLIKALRRADESRTVDGQVLFDD